jgi:hypothetical protein
MDMDFEATDFPEDCTAAGSGEGDDCPDCFIEEVIEATRIKRRNAPHYRHRFAIAFNAVRELRSTLRRAPRAPHRVGRRASYAKLAASSSDDGGDPDPDAEAELQSAAPTLRFLEVLP